MRPVSRHRLLDPAGTLLLAIVAGTLAASAVPLAAQVPGTSRDAQPAPAAEAGRRSALADIDRLAMRAVALVRDHVPDRAGTAVRVLPFTTDTGAATRLGHRLQSAVHLRLLREYRSTTVQVASRRPLTVSMTDGARAVTAAAQPARHALELEIQPFRETVRVILRMLSSGTVTAGDWVDIPISDELRALLDDAADEGTGPGTRSRARFGGSPSAAAPDAGTGSVAGAEPERPRMSLPDVITVDRGQHRYTADGEDWVTLQVPVPGFYLLEGRSISGPLTLSVHYDRAGPPVATAREDVPAVAGSDPGGLPPGVDRMLGIFSGPRRIYARVSAAAEEDVAFYLRLRPLDPPRRFADGTVYAVPLEAGTGFQILRVFRSGSYRVVVEAGADDVELRVLGVPHMHSVAPAGAAPPAAPGTVEPGQHRYHLAAGDYLIEVTAAHAARAAQVCWAAEDTTACAG